MVVHRKAAFDKIGCFLDEAVEQEKTIRQPGRIERPELTGTLKGSVELAGDGALLCLPGGLAKAAIGVGYRSTYLKNDRGAGYPLNFAHTQNAVYAYGELSVPLIGSGNARPGIERFNFSAAVRYEDYDAIGDIATPKLGLIYSPIKAIDFKASWGKSFRAWRPGHRSRWRQ